MAGKRTRMTSRFEPQPDTAPGTSEAGADPFRIRKLLDPEIGKAMSAYRLQLLGANPYRLLEFGSRCAERVWRVGVVLRVRKPEASRPVRLVTGLSALAARLAEEAVKDPGRLKQAEIAKEEEEGHQDVAAAEIEIYLADRWSHAILELGRIAARLFEALEAFYERDDALLARQVAAVAAHSEHAMERGLGDEAVKKIRGAISADLEALTGEKSPTPFPGLWTSGYNPVINHLSKKDIPAYNEEEFRYQNIDVEKIRFQQSQEPPPGLEELSVPRISPGTESELKVPKKPHLHKELVEIEERTRKRLREQLDDLQGVLNLIAGKSFGTAAVHSQIIEFITTLADRASAMLTISGVFPDLKDPSKMRVLTLEPITIRCDNPKTRSLAIRTAGAGKVQARIANTTTFPQLYAIPRERYSKISPPSS